RQQHYPLSFICLLASLFFFFSCPSPPRDLHSFPTRALPISPLGTRRPRLHAAGELGVERRHREEDVPGAVPGECGEEVYVARHQDRKSTRLNSSHVSISYAVFCLKKKKKKRTRLC